MNVTLGVTVVAAVVVDTTAVLGTPKLGNGLDVAAGDASAIGFPKVNVAGVGVALEVGDKPFGDDSVLATTDVVVAIFA